LIFIEFLISAANSPVHLLKILTSEDDPKAAHIFQFVGDNAKEQQRNE
jgi:hypothetical protein